MARRGGPSVGPLAFGVALLLIPAGLLFLPTTLLLAVGMLPAVVAFVVDRDPERYAAIAVGPLNFAGLLPFLLDLWQGANSMAQLEQIAARPANWILVYGAAAFGWAIYTALPPAVAGVLVARRRRRIEELKAKRMRLVSEWGEEVTGAAPPAA
jgi:hypothetical protein